jgi:hypothetical protein
LRAEAFSSQVESLGGSENATKQSIFKPSGITWRLGKCDQTNISFSSQAGSLGGSEKAIKQTSHFQAKWNHVA